MARQGRLRAGAGSGKEWEWQVAGGRWQVAERKNPAGARMSEPRTEKARDKRGEGVWTKWGWEC